MVTRVSAAMLSHILQVMHGKLVKVVCRCILLAEKECWPVKNLIEASSEYRNFCRGKSSISIAVC